MENIILCISSTILGGGGAWFISRFAFRFGLMDIPNERSSHEIPISIPKGGGIGILAAFVMSSLVFNIRLGFWLSATFLGPQITQISQIIENEITNERPENVQDYRRGDGGTVRRLPRLNKKTNAFNRAGANYTDYERRENIQNYRLCDGGAIHRLRRLRRIMISCYER